MAFRPGLSTHGSSFDFATTACSRSTPSKHLHLSAVSFLKITPTSIRPSRKDRDYSGQENDVNKF